MWKAARFSGHGAKRVGAAAFLALTCWVGPTHAQVASSDPVDEVRRALKAPARDLAQRSQDVMKATATLTSIDDLRRALALLEWRDEDADDKLAVIDLANRAAAATRFEQGVRSILQQGDPDSR